jgi:hypothetical protein
MNGKYFSKNGGYNFKTYLINTAHEVLWLENSLLTGHGLLPAWLETVQYGFIAAGLYIYIHIVPHEVCPPMLLTKPD